MMYLNMKQSYHYGDLRQSGWDSLADLLRPERAAHRLLREDYDEEEAVAGGQEPADEAGEAAEEGDEEEVRKGGNEED